MTQLEPNNAPSPPDSQEKEHAALRPGRPVGAVLRNFGRAIVSDARTAIDPAQTSDETIAVHEFRRAMKRWRAYMRLLTPCFEEAEALRIGARDLARLLGQARDTQAALDALKDLGGPTEQLSARSFATMRDRLEERAQAEHGDAFASASRRQLRDYIERAAGTFELWALDDVEFAAIADALAITYRRGRLSRPVHWAAAEEEELHTLRRRVVEHRHQMDLVIPLWPRLGRLWADEAQRLRVRLGSHQDLAVLQGLTAPHQVLAPWRSRLMPLIEARKAEHVETSMRMSGRLYAERPRDFRRRLIALWHADCDD